MTRKTRLLVAGVAVALLTGSMPASAGEAAPTGGPVMSESGGSPRDALSVPRPDGAGLQDLPVHAIDVTITDANLGATAHEVTVLTMTDGAARVTKLRADTAQDAHTLATALDARPGIVAARTRPVRALAATPEPLSTKQTYLRTIGVQAAWRYSQGAGVRVAVLDSGVDARHRELTGRVARLIDLLPDTTPTAADTEHGTRVASIIAAARNGVGMAGVAPAATILPVEVLDPAGLGDTSTVARGIVAATNAGAKVINLSLGGPGRDPVLDGACAYAKGKGVVVVAAGGNSFVQGNRPQYPAASPHVIAVASVDSHGKASFFANSGRYIDLAAPGENVLAAAPRGYNRGSGTSFAAPQVAGTIALMMAANTALRPATLQALAERTAKDDVSRDGRDQRVGFGVVRADRAVRAAVSLRKAPHLATARARVLTLDATPEPVRKGKSATVIARVQLLRPNGTWFASFVPSLVRFQFKPLGGKYRTVGYAGTNVGVAQLRYVPKRSGRWRALVLQADGSWTASRTDYVRRR